jgi:energy-coupling factor transporter ATP-binding protein EcfA2
MDRKSIEMIFTDEHNKALDLMLNPEVPLVFVTGKAGSGKSTLLKHFQDICPFHSAFVAPTGVAALNIRGMTLHSFLGLPVNVTKEKAMKIRPRRIELLQNLELLVIDEISMVRADLLDVVDIFLRRFGPNPLLPFGGIRMIWFGDLYQLPPVVTSQDQVWLKHEYQTPYFFGAHVFRSIPQFEIVELKKIFRQSDPTFIEFLNRVRRNQLQTQDLNWLHQEVKKNVSRVSKEDKKIESVVLTTTNSKAEMVNKSKLDGLPGRDLVLEGNITGLIDKKELPTEEFLRLKVGAQLMLLNNDPNGEWVNGSIGRVLGWKANDLGTENEVLVEIGTSKRVVTVSSIEWEYYDFEWDHDNKKVISKKRGQYKQHPIKLAWAMTIHKSQGLTFDRVHIDFDRGTFAHGQAYVALSRCRSLSGMTLARPFRLSDIKFDASVDQFLSSQLNRNQDHQANQMNQNK